MDRHMNIFEHYITEDALPIENNISRGFVILLNEEPFVLDRFLDLLLLNGKNNVSDIITKPDVDNRAEVYFQSSIADLANKALCKNVLGVSLTTKNLPESAIIGSVINAKFITDIGIVCKDTLIIVEVKRNETDCMAQLLQQVGSYIDLMGEEKENIQKYLISLKWEDIIKMLLDVQVLQSKNRICILDHYLGHLQLRYEYWFPVQNLSKIDFEINKDMLNKRISALTKKFCKDDKEVIIRPDADFAPVDFGWASEICIRTEKIEDKHYLEFKIWPGDTKGQGNLLFTDKRTFSWLYTEKLNIQNYSFEMGVKPYYKFSHFQKGVMWISLNRDYYVKEYEDKASKWNQLFQKIAGRWYRDNNKVKNWKSLDEIFKNSSIINYDEFLSDYRNLFENTSRNYFDISFGFEVKVYIPYEVAQTVDKGKTDDCDKLFELLNAILFELRDMIDNV